MTLDFFAYSKADFTMNITKFTHILFFILSFFFLNPSFSQNCAELDGSIWVTNINDEGIGSLREAINCANNTPGPNHIKFNISGDGEHRIFIGSTSGQALPSLIDEGTTIDGSTESDFGIYDDYSPKIILDGELNEWTAPINAIFILADDCAIYSLEITNFPDDGIDVYQADNINIGAPNKGNIIYNNGAVQDVFPGTAGSWEGCGIVLRSGATNCRVRGNIIGTNKSLAAGLGNEFCGIINRTGANGNIIGGENFGEANIIAHNALGIRVDNSVSVRIQQNSMFCNDTVAIQLRNNANFNKAAPVINTANTNVIGGTASPGERVEVYISSDNGCPGTPCQGKTLLGAVQANNSGSWSLSGNPYAGGVTLSGGELITATATDQSNNTSPFANCVTAINTISCASSNGTIWVTNTNDEGDGSLRAAIDCANSTSGANTIKFDIPGTGTHRIYIGSTSGQELPPLMDARTIIDASTQPGYGVGGNYSPKIILDGIQNTWLAAINAIWILGDFCEIYALEITNFPDDGIDVTHANFAKIGDVNKGNVIYNVGAEQDFFPNSNSGPWEGCAIVMKSGASNCTIRGNILGTNYNRTLSVGNEYCGIVVQHGGDNHLIGGNQPGQGNVIAHHRVGIRISENSFNCRMERNSFYCNSDTGIELRGNANAAYTAPSVLSSSTTIISGISSANDRIELYLYDDAGCANAPCQGKVFLGTAVASANGAWSVQAPFQGVSLNQNSKVTAIASDFLGNTSGFSDCFSLAPACAINATVTNVDHASCNQNNGSFNVSVSGGSGFYSFDIGEGPVANSFFNLLAPGSYSVTVSDGSGCFVVTGATIDNSGAPTASVINQTDASCGSSTGSFTVSVFGGSSPYTYDIGQGATNNSLFDNLTPGDYTVTVSDADDCEVTVGASIGDTPAPSASISSLIHADCEQETGSFAVAVLGGTEPFTFDIGNGPVATNTFSALSPATYIVTVTDANGCTAQQQATINASSPPMGDVTSISDATCNQNNGGFTLAVTDGTAPYSFDLGSGPTNSPVFSGLAPGTYTVTITDANNCQDIEGITVGSTQVPNGNIFDVESATCGQFNGSFQVEVFGGTAPFTFDIGDGEINQGVFNGLSGGLYTVTITDAAGCSDVQGVNVPDSAPPIASIESVSNAGCGQGNGSVTIGVEGGSPPYIFDIGNGPTDNPVFDDLPPGSYNINITDANECSANLVVTIGGATPPQVSVENIQNSTCGQNNGSATISVSVGLPPYTFDIGNGPTTSPNFTGLSAGNYTLTVTDANECDVTETITIGDSEGPTATISNLQNVSCGGTNGAFTVEVTGGNAPYSFDIGNGVTTDPNFDDLDPGDYTVSVSDADDCTTEVSATITGSTQLSASIFDVQMPSCGLNNGSFSVMVEGGTPPFSYDIGFGSSDSPDFSNLIPDTYFVTVTGAGGCSGTRGVTLVNNDLPVSAGFTVSRTDFTVTLTNSSFGATAYSWTFGDGNSSTDEEPVHTYTESGEFTICLNVANACSSDVLCQAITVGDGVEDPKATISGIVVTETGQGVDLANVFCTGQLPFETGLTGEYEFENLPVNNTYNIRPEKDINAENGISTFDLFLITKHILAEDTLDSPYKIIAADVNNSGSVTNFDVVKLRKIILGIDTTFADVPSWRFIPEDFVFPNPFNPFITTFPESKEVSIIDDVTGVNFIGVKMGDVNNSVEQGMLLSVDERNRDNFYINMPDLFLEKGMEYRIELSSNDLQELLGFQFTLEWDTELAEVLEVSAGDLNGFNAANLGLNFIEKGQLTSSWVKRDEVSIAHDAILFTVQIQAKQNIALSDLFQINSTITQQEAYRQKGYTAELENVRLHFVQPKTIASFETTAFPNPFVEESRLQFSLEREEQLTLRLFDGTGRLLWTEKQQFSKGEQQFVIGSEQIGDYRGVLFYEIVGKEMKDRGKLLRHF